MSEAAPQSLSGWREKYLLFIPRRLPAFYSHIVRALIDYKNEKNCHVLNAVKYIFRHLKHRKDIHLPTEKTSLMCPNFVPVASACSLDK